MGDGDKVERERPRRSESEDDEDDKKKKKRKDKKKDSSSSSSNRSSSTKKRSKKREIDQLDSDDEHIKEVQRLRSYSQDLDVDDFESSKTKATASSSSSAAAAKPKEKDASALIANKRRRTRSMDAKEEAEVVAAIASPMTAQEWRKEHSITLRSFDKNDENSIEAIEPFFRFQDAPFHERIQQALSHAGYKAPTSIQAQAWPLALKGRDLIGIAKTGSGKTCGFLLPVFHQYLTSNPYPKQGFVKPILLILAPTRELSVQILEEAQKFGRHLGIRAICCYGGAPKYAQITSLQRGVECIIATPGRLNDLLEMKKADLSNISYLVLDEADRMLDMGFEPQIRSILNHVPTHNKRQTMLFSATWPREIQKLAQEFLTKPIQINVGEVNALVANKDITQTIIVCDDDDKLSKLEEILSDLVKKSSNAAASSSTNAPANSATTTNGNSAASPSSSSSLGNKQHHDKVIVFVAKKISCHELANRLWDDGFAVDSLHGDRPQWERTRVMQAFKSGQLRMLIATDVAARGLDVKDVGTVINYDMPSGVNAAEDYVHRIGRTGRAGQKGQAYTFFTNRDKKCATQLVDVLVKAGQTVPEELKAMLPRPRFQRGGSGGGRGGHYSSSRGGGGRGYMQSGRGYMNGGGSGGGRGGGYGRGSYGGGGRGGRGGGRGGRGGGGGYRR